MLSSGKKFALCATKEINIQTLVLSEKKILNETKNHNPHCKLNGRSLRLLYISLARPHLEYANPVWNPYLKEY
jgi:hypothetical protein